MPAAVLVAVATNLVSSAIWDVLREPGAPSKFAGARDRFDAAAELATSELSKVFRSVTDENRPEVEAFLRSTEVRHVVAQLYRTQLYEQQPGLRDLRQAFVALWGHQHPALVRAISAYDLFDALAATCQRVIEIEIGQGRLIAHEAASAARHRIVLDRFAAIERQLSLLSQGGQDAPGEIDEAEQRLRKKLAQALSHISPPNLRGEKDIPIDDIFVSPTFVDGAGETLNYDEIIRFSQRLVVRGDPGAGKSTFGRKLARDLALARLGPRGGSPMLVFLELRTFARDTESRPASIRDYLAIHIASRFQLTVAPLTLDYLLTAGRLGVVFDGLDELPVVAGRRQIRDSIESFADEYPLAPLVITSRLVGYEHASLDSNSFHHMRLADFTDAQVTEYANLWFSLDERYKEENVTSAVEAFISESKAAPDLRVNPLMLGLMCVLYRGQSYIPRNRPELYRQCATFLFETWDRHRGIVTEKPFERFLRPAMRELAYWIYTNPDLARGVQYEAAVANTKHFLISLGYDVAVSAEDAARSFIDFCRGRAWVFSDVGADAEDRDLFAFTHRTFLEFFAAERILDQNETTEQLVKALGPRIYEGEWDIVPQLAIQIHEERHLRSADKCMTALMRGAGTETARANALGFAVRLLGGVVPAPETVAEVTGAVLDQFRSASHDYLTQRTTDERVGVEAELRNAQELLVGLLQCDPEARPLVASQIEMHLDSWLSDDERVTRWLGADLAVSGAWFAGDALALAISEQRDWWIDRLRHSREQIHDRLRELNKADLAVAVLSCAADDLSATELVSAHGIGALFQAPFMPLASSWSRAATQRLIRDELQGSSALTSLIVATEAPWIPESALRSMLAEWQSFARVDESPAMYPVGLLLLCAALEPALDGPHHPSSWPGIGLLDRVGDGEATDGIIDDMPLTLAERVLNARGQRDEAAELREELLDAGCGDAVPIIEAWIRREVRFVERTL